MHQIIFAGLFVMLATSLGAFFAAVFKKLPNWWLDVGLAFSGGVMLVASFTSLIIPATEIGSIYIVMLGIVLGFLAIFLIENLVPHEEYITKLKITENYKERVKSIFMIVTAIIIHNIPEGMAVGISMANDTEKGWATAIAIGTQDIPEGLAVSLPLIFLTERVWIPVLIGVLSGFSEFVFAVLGGYAFTIFHSLLPLGLSFAGGAMIYVTIKEVFPEVYKNKNELLITVGFLIGLLTMLYLDITLG